MSADTEQEEGARRAKLEFSIGRKSFEKAHTAWSNAPSDLKPALLLTGGQLSRAETWLVDFPEKLSESEKRFILKSKSSKPDIRAKAASRPARGILSTFVSTPVLWAMAIVLFVVARNYVPRIVERAVEKSNAEFAAAKGVRETGGKGQAVRHADAGANQYPAKPAAGADPAMPSSPPRSAIESIDQPNRKWLHVARATTADEKVAKLVDMASRRWDIGEQRTSMLIALEAIQTSIDAAGPGKAPKGISGAASIFVHKLASKKGVVAAPSDIASKPAMFCGQAHRLVVAGGPSLIETWRTDTPALSSAIEDRPQLFDGSSVDASCSRIVLTAEEHAAEVISLATGARVSELAGHEAPVLATAFSPDGAVVATASEDRTAGLWDAATGKRTTTLSGHDDRVLAVTFSADGKLVATGSADATVRIWEAKTGREIRALKGHAGAVIATAFSADGKVVLTTSRDGTAALWDAASGRRMHVLSGTGSVVGAHLSGNGKLAITLSDVGEITAWNADTGVAGARLAGRGEPLRNVMLSDDGGMLVAVSWNGDAVLWNAEQGLEVARLNARGERAVAAAFSPDGQTVSGLLSEGSLMSWPVMRGTDSILKQAREVMPGCLAREERDRLGLTSAPPRWCSATAESTANPMVLDGLALDGKGTGVPAAATAD